MRRTVGCLALVSLAACLAVPIKPVPPSPPVVIEQPPVAMAGVGIQLSSRVAGVQIYVGPTSCTSDERGHAWCYPVPVGVQTVRVDVPPGFLPFPGEAIEIQTPNTDLAITLDRDGTLIAKRTGLTRLDNRTFVDDGGPELAIGASVFWAAWAYTHDRERLDKNLEYLRARGVDYIRVFGSVDGASWADRAIGPDDPHYAETIAGLTDHVYDDYGLKIEWSILAGAPQDTPARNQRTVEAFAWMARGREQKIQYFEISNENNGPADVAELRALTRQLQDQTDVLVAASSPEGYCDKYSEMYGGGVGDFLTVRTDRSPGENGWRHARQAWEAIQFCDGVPRGGSDDEPIGPRSSVASDDDPTRLAMHAADAWLSGLTAFVYHAGPGVRGGGKWDVDPPGGAFWAPREANFWDVPKGDDILAALSATRAALPPFLPNWRKANGHWPDAPLKPDAFWTDGPDHGVTRAHEAYDGGHFVALFFAIKNYVDVRADRPVRFKVIRPRDGAVLREVSLDSGQTHRLSESADGPGLIAVGDFR